MNDDPSGIGNGGSSLAQARLMTALAGFVDAVGYTATGHLYLSFMSGNSAQFGMALARGDLHVVGWAGAVIATFVLGAFLGRLLAAAELRTGRPLVLSTEFACLLAAGLLFGLFAAEAALLLAGLAMGLQNAIPAAQTGKTFVTGSLFALGDALGRACLGSGGWGEAAAHALAWAAFITGVTVGALSVAAWGAFAALLLAAVVVGLRMTWSFVRPPRRAGKART